MRPRGIANWVFTTGFTAVMSGYAVGSQLLREDPARMQRHTRCWARGVARGVGLEVETYGAERLDPARSYVLMANHQSHIDIVALFNALPMVPGFLAKAELRRVPLFGRAMEAGGHVFVDRGAERRDGSPTPARGWARDVLRRCRDAVAQRSDPYPRARHASAVAAIKVAAEGMRRGDSIVIFPEGTRSSRREVLPFKKGGFHLAKQSGVPVVPIGIRGTADILPKHGRAIVPGRCEVHIGEPIDAARVAELPLPALMDEVRLAIAALCGLPLA